MARAAVVALLVAGCGAQPAVDYGRQLFDDASISSAASNPFKCSTCHEVTPTATKQLPGYTMYDAAVRTAWWGGQVDNFLDATNQCVYNFMRGNPLMPDDDKGRALFVYLQSLAPDPTAPTLPLTVVQNIVDVPSGDATAGQKTWTQSCGNCHGAPHTGQGRLSDAVSIVPDDTIANHPTMTRLVVIEKVRHGKFFNVGGNMPLFSVEAMSDAQLGDILAYLEGFGLPATP